MEFSPETVKREKQVEKTGFQLPEVLTPETVAAANSAELTSEELESLLETQLTRHEALIDSLNEEEKNDHSRIEEQIELSKNLMDALHLHYEKIVDPTFLGLRERIAREYGKTYVPSLGGGFIASLEDAASGEYLFNERGERFGPFTSIGNDVFTEAPRMVEDGSGTCLMLKADGTMFEVSPDTLGFHEGFAIETMKDKHGDEKKIFIDTDGNQFPPGVFFKEASSFIQGCARVVDESGHRLLLKDGTLSQAYKKIEPNLATDTNRDIVRFEAECFDERLVYLGVDGKECSPHVLSIFDWREGMGCLLNDWRKDATGESLLEYKIMLEDGSMYPEYFTGVLTPKFDMVAAKRMNTNSGEEEWLLISRKGKVLHGPSKYPPEDSAVSWIGYTDSTYTFYLPDGTVAGPFESAEPTKVHHHLIGGSFCRERAEGTSFVTSKGAHFVPGAIVAGSASYYTLRQKAKTRSEEQTEITFVEEGYFGPLRSEFRSYDIDAKGFVVYHGSVLDREGTSGPRDGLSFLCEETGVLLGPFDQFYYGNENEIVVGLEQEDGFVEIVITRDGNQCFLKEGEKPKYDSWVIKHVPVNGMYRGKPFDYGKVEKLWDTDWN